MKSFSKTTAFLALGILVPHCATALDPDPAPLKNSIPVSIKPATPSIPKPANPHAEAAPLPHPAAHPTPPRQKQSPEQRDTVVRLQTFLDASLFGPGKIDGQTGEFTVKAISLYQQAHGLEQTGTPENLPLPKTQIYQEYTLQAEDKRFVGSVPSSTAEQSKRRYLPYGSFLEFLSERFHSSPTLLEELNPSIKLDSLKVGDTVKVPAVEPFKIEEVSPVANLPEISEFKARRIQISRKERILQLLDGDKLIAAFPITPGSTSLPTPPGKWRILAISTLPTFRWDEGVLNHGVRTDECYMLPSGPNNPVGVVWCALNKPGIGIHGTNQPETIGRAFSHGCMRVANWDVIRLVKQISAGVRVDIE